MPNRIFKVQVPFGFAQDKLATEDEQNYLCLYQKIISIYPE